MAEAKVIEAVGRKSRGTGGARAIRREGKVPGIMYGGGVQGEQPIAIDQNQLLKIIRRGAFLSTVFQVDVDGQKVTAIPRAVQLDPVRDMPLHVDFQRIGANEKVRVFVAVHFLHEDISPGLKRGGVLNVVRREVEVWALPEQIPEYFEADLKELDIGDSIHISAVKIPDGIDLEIDDRDFTIATIVGAVPDKEEEPAVAKAAEGEEAKKDEPAKDAKDKS